MAGPLRTEAEILGALQGGDASAAAELVVLHQRAVHRLAARLVGRWGATDDIVQETFVRAFVHIDRIDPARGAGAWLLRTCAGLCRDFARHTSRRETPAQTGVSDAPVFSVSARNPEHAASDREARDHLDVALGRLTPKLREALLLHYVEGMSFRQMSEITGTPIGVLKMRALRARAQMRALMEGE